MQKFQIIAVATCFSVLAPLAIAEPFNGTLEEEVDAFIGSYAYVWSEPGPVATVERIKSGLATCEKPMSGTSAPDRFANGDIAFYREGETLYAEGPRLAGRVEMRGVSNEVGDGRSNFSFELAGKGKVEVELAHFQRYEGVWPGVLITGGSLDGVWVNCATDVARPVKPRW